MPQMGEPANLAVTTDPKIPVLVGAVVELSFQNPVKTSLAKTLVEAPHWKLGDIPPGTTSKKPVAYARSTANVIAKLKVKITESKNVSGTGKLTGTLGPLTFECDCPMGEGDHDVDAKIDELPDTLVWVRGDIAWELDVPGTARFGLNSTRIELYTLIENPKDPFPGHKWGVPVEALRWMHLRGGVGGMMTGLDLVTAVTRTCHKRPKTKYDTRFGGAHFLSADNVYELLAYVAPPTSDAIANCYDQAGAVYLLSRAFGVAVEIVYLGNSDATPDENFGYINTTELVGVPGCNNPFFERPSPLYVDAKQNIVIRACPKPHADPNWGGDLKKLADKGARTSFGNQAFCSYAGGIYDACAGPATGSSQDDYATAAIDSTTDYYALWGQKPGTAAQISPISSRRAELLPTDWQ